MFGFGKKKSARGLAHSTKRKDWEKILDELFIEVIHGSKNGLAVISNTTKMGEHDSQGKVSAQLTFRIGNNTSSNLKDAIRQVNLQQMAKMFALRLKAKPNESDCYKIKNLGLPDNALIYFIEQPDSKKALIVFSSPIMQKELARLVNAIDQILGGEEKNVAQVKRKAPQSFSKFQFNKTKPQLLKDRLDYLETLDAPSPKEQQELADLEEFMIRAMKENF